MKMKLLEQMFDFEVFPNWWCCVVGKYPQDDDIPESIKDDFLVVTSDMADARERLLNIVGDRNYVNMGYNIKYYDNIILNGVANGFINGNRRLAAMFISMNDDTAWLIKKICIKENKHTGFVGLNRYNVCPRKLITRMLRFTRKWEARAL